VSDSWAKIIQPFGPTAFAVEPSYGGYLHFHTGIDLLAEYGTPIVAAAGGKVTATGYADYYGIRVEVTDSFGLVEVYAHMSGSAVAVGRKFSRAKRSATSAVQVCRSVRICTSNLVSVACRPIPVG